MAPIFVFARFIPSDIIPEDSRVGRLFGDDQLFIRDSLLDDESILNRVSRSRFCDLKSWRSFAEKSARLIYKFVFVYRKINGIRENTKIAIISICLQKLLYVRNPGRGSRGIKSRDCKSILFRKIHVT